MNRCPDCHLLVVEEGDGGVRQLHTSRCPRNPLNAPAPSRRERLREHLPPMPDIDWTEIVFGAIAIIIACAVLWGILALVDALSHHH